MEDSQDESRIALKIVFILSLLLVTMDIMEIYFAYGQLKETSTTLNSIVFESCIKYHILSQMFFTFFATLAGISACIMSLGLIINFEFFAIKVMDSFLHFNYLIFGPYLFMSCILGYYYFSQIAFNCDNSNINKKYLNFSTVLALFICILFSFIVTLGYSIFWSLRKFMHSIRFRPGGNYILGRIFWRYVFNRSNDSIQFENGRENNDGVPISNSITIARNVNGIGIRNENVIRGNENILRSDHNDLDMETYVDMISHGNSLNRNRQSVEMSEIRNVSSNEINHINHNEINNNTNLINRSNRIPLFDGQHNNLENV